MAIERENPRELLERETREEGLIPLGFVRLRYPEEFARFRRWMEEGRHGGLGFLESHWEVREHPERLLPGARSALVFALPYDLGDSRRLDGPPRIAQYARFRDYHRVLREKGDRIVERVVGRLGRSVSEFRTVVDSAPVLERALAARTLGGFIGKNTCFIHPERGSFLLLGELLTPFDVESEGGTPWDSRIRRDGRGCGGCTACQVSCPTGALNRDYTVETGRCLSYWSIEHRGPVPEEFWPHFAKYWYGCDICQLVCPYNGAARERTLPAELKERTFPDLFDVAVMDQRRYEDWFGGTPLTRAKRNGLRRNALIAMTVTAHPELDRAVRECEADDGSPVRETLEQIRRYRKRTGP